MGEGDSGEVVETGGRDGKLTLVSDPTDEARRIQDTIDGARAKIARSLATIQDEVEQSLDWQGWVAENPWKTVGIAAAVGFYIGLR